jgi:hypothetical protein
MDPLTITCPVCNAAAGHPCTAPTSTGRRVVEWTHISRQDRVHIIHFGPENTTPDGTHVRAACGVKYIDPRDTFTGDTGKVTCLRCRGTHEYAAEGGALIA